MEYDNSYKLLFSYPKMVADLVQGFVREPWVQSVDFDTLERVNGNYVSDDLRDREDDIIWRVRWRGDWLYVYLLLEFQSSVDRFMAVRLLVYIGLLYQDLIRRRDLTPSRKLPPVVPLVLYNGQRPWTAPTSLESLIESLPGGLSVYRPSLRYLLIDEGNYREEALPDLPNLAASLIRLEKSRDPETLQQALQELVMVLRAPEDDPLRRAFTVWLRRVLLPARLPGLSLPAVEDIGEIQTMLAERVIEWTQQWKEEGLREGLREGREQERQSALAAERALLCRQTEKRFGEACAQMLSTYLESMEDRALLDDIGEWIVTCDTGDALLAQVRTRTSEEL